MKVSQLITNLSGVITSYGDLTVSVRTECQVLAARSVRAVRESDPGYCSLWLTRGNPRDAPYGVDILSFNET